MPAKRYVCTNCAQVRRSAGSCKKCGSPTDLVEIQHTAFRLAYIVPMGFGFFAFGFFALVAMVGPARDSAGYLAFGFFAMVGWMIVALPFNVVYDRRMDRQAREVFLQRRAAASGQTLGSQNSVSEPPGPTEG